MLQESVKKAFKKDGVYIWKKLIPSAKADDLRDLVLDMAEYEKKIDDKYIYPFDPSGKTQRVWNLTNKSQEFRSLLEIDELNEMMNFIFARSTKHQLFHLSSFQANIISPGAPKQKLHMDTPFPEPIPPWAAKANSIWMLNDFTEINGATEFLRGSHKIDRKPNQEADQELPLELATGLKGGVLFTHGNLWHCAGANNSRDVRVGLLCSFAASFMKEIASEEDQSIIISDSVKAELSDKLLAVLGVGHGIKQGAMVDHDEGKR